MHTSASIGVKNSRGLGESPSSGTTEWSPLRRSRTVEDQRVSCAVGYCRRSTDRQEQSIGDQQSAIERYCHEQGLTLLRWFIDDAISGTSTAGRRAFQDLIEHATSEGRDFATIVCYDVKRFGRVDNDEAGYYRHLLRQAGVEVRYASEGFTGDGTDDLLRPVKQWQARQESKDLAKVTIRGLLSKTEAKGGKGESGGWWMGGAPPFGYDLAYQSQNGEALFTLRYMPDGTKQMLDPGSGKVTRTLGREETVAVSRRDRCRLVTSEDARQEAVRTIFRLYVEERRGFKAVADWLNEHGVATARGPQWSERYSGLWAIGTIRAIITNPVYAGDLVWNRRTDARFYKIKAGRAVERHGVRGRRLEPNDRSDWHIIENAHAAIVPKRTFELAQQIMSAKPESRSQTGVNPRTGRAAGDPELRGGWTGPRSRFVLSGLMTCGDCGSRYEGYHQTRRRGEDGCLGRAPGYACGGYIRHGRSTCSLGFVQQSAAEDAVITAVGDFYRERYGNDTRLAVSKMLNLNLSSDARQAEQGRKRLLLQVERADKLTRKLLDSAKLSSVVAQLAVEKRLIELTTQRAAAQSQLQALDRLSLTGSQITSVLDDTVRTIQAVRDMNREGEHTKSLLRRCVERVVVDRATGHLAIKVRGLPMVVGGPDAGGLETIQAVF